MRALLTTIAGYLRHLFPPKGTQYRTFNLGAAVGGAAFCVYVQGNPSAGAQQALAWIESPTNLTVGWVLAASGLFAVATSYWWPATRFGVMAAGGVAAMWCGALLIGMLVAPSWSALGSSIAWGFFAHYAWEIAHDEQEVCAHLDSTHHPEVHDQ